MHAPFGKFADWYSTASTTAGIIDASAMTLATVSAEGKPAARIVLLKSHDASGFTFYGNMNSRKFRELAANPNAALTFHWAPLEKQVRIEGAVEKVSDAEADAYFKSRARGSQIGAWASLQTQPLANREELLARIAQVEKQYEGKDVPRPPHWSGWRLIPTRIEFWSQIEFRLHNREVFTRENANAPWQVGLLYP